MTITTVLEHNLHSGELISSEPLVPRPRTAMLLASVCALGLTIGTSSMAFAQASSDAQNNDDNEIIVTANKREQSLRDVSISISAVKPGDLKKLGGDKFSEFLQGVAGVSTQDLGNQSQNVVFRGITNAPDGDAAVAVYFDELPFGGANFSAQVKPIDIERFEVLRGPQPILYGAGSLTGTLRLIPKRPNFSQLEYGADIGLSSIESSNGIGFDVSAYVNIPVVPDKLAVRVAGFVEKEKGFVDNIVLNRKEGGFESEGGRASVAFAPTETINFLAQYIYQSTSSEGNSFYRPILGRANPSLGRFQTDSLPTQLNRKFHFGGLTANIELGAATLTSVTSYRQSRFSDVVDRSVFASFFGLPFPEIQSASDEEGSNFSQEVRLSSIDGGSFNWVLGGFFQKAKTSINRLLETPDSLVLIQNSETEISNRDISVFGQAGLQISPTFDVSLGARYTWFSRFDSSITSFFGGPAGPANISSSKTSAFNPQLTLTFKPDGRHTYYARVAKGYRAPNASFSNTPGCVVPKLLPDDVINYEIGTKLSLAGGAVNINAAAYYIDWRGIPIFVTPPGCGAIDSFLVNAGKGKSYGLEAELFAKLSKSVSLNASVTLGRSVLGAVPASFTGGLKGEQLPGNPNLRISGGLSYAAPISDKASFFADASAVYVGPYKNFLSGNFTNLFGEIFLGPNGEVPLIDGVDPAFLRDPGAGDYATVNLRTGLNFGNWSASIYANNVLNSRGTSLIIYPVDQVSPGEAPFIAVKPRTIGLDVSVKF